MTRSGSSSSASDSASARISRPSASVLVISMVFPERLVSTSPGRMARPDGMFSTIGAYVVTLTGRPRSAMAKVAARTAAAPPMSNFIVAIEAPDLRLSPPES